MFCLIFFFCTMDSLFQFALENAKKHGLSFIILCGAIYWFDARCTRLEFDVNRKTEEYENFLKEDHFKMVKVIENNTAVLENILKEKR